MYVLGFLEGGKGGLVGEQLVPDLLKQLGLLLLLFLIDAVSDLLFETILFELDLHPPEFLLGVPVVLELLELVDAHVHQDLN